MRATWMTVLVLVGCSDGDAVDSADTAPVNYEETYTCRGLAIYEAVAVTNLNVEPRNAVGCYEDETLGCVEFTPADEIAELVPQVFIPFEEDPHQESVLWDGPGWYISCTTHWAGPSEEDRDNIGYPWTITWSAPI